MKPCKHGVCEFCELFNLFKAKQRAKQNVHECTEWGIREKQRNGDRNNSLPKKIECLMFKYIWIYGAAQHNIHRFAEWKREQIAADECNKRVNTKKNYCLKIWLWCLVLECLIFVCGTKGIIFQTQRMRMRKVCRLEDINPIHKTNAFQNEKKTKLEQKYGKKKIKSRKNAKTFRSGCRNSKNRYQTTWNNCRNGKMEKRREKKCQKSPLA